MEGMVPTVIILTIKPFVFKGNYHENAWPTNDGFMQRRPYLFQYSVF